MKVVMSDFILVCIYIEVIISEKRHQNQHSEFLLKSFINKKNHVHKSESQEIRWTGED